MAPDPKPKPRVVDRDAQPVDARPLAFGRCPICKRTTRDLSRHHVVPKGQAGDDLPENLVWACGDGTRGCHGVLTHHNRGDHGLTFEDVAARLLAYLLSEVPAVVSYTRTKKWDGWLFDYYEPHRASAA